MKKRKARRMSNWPGEDGEQNTSSCSTSSCSTSSCSIHHISFMCSTLSCSASSCSTPQVFHSAFFLKHSMKIFTSIFTQHRSSWNASRRRYTFESNAFTGFTCMTTYKTKTGRSPVRNFCTSAVNSDSLVFCLIRSFYTSLPDPREHVF
jgi:hypothetical protein